MFLKTPPMGFNTWNTFGPNIDEKCILETADAMVSEGLLDAGYNYLVIDDCWSERDRDPITRRLVADHIKFPHGMKYVADYVHSKGLKFGMYSCCGVRTCADYPSSYDYEFLDAETFAEWGVDYLKYDNCNVPESADSPTLYRRMGMALRACGRDIVFSMCNWGSDDVWSWARGCGGDLYRSTGDINDSFNSFFEIAKSQAWKFGNSGPGCFNDMDMLTVGMYGKGNVGNVGCNDAEYRSQFALWCMFGTPLMLGCDIRNMTPETKALITNKELIAINQDPECRAPLCCGQFKSDCFVFYRHLANNEIALLFINPKGDGTEGQGNNIRAYASEIGLATNSGYHIEATDIFTGEKLQEKDYFKVWIPSHDCRLFRGKIVKD